MCVCVCACVVTIHNVITVHMNLYEEGLTFRKPGGGGDNTEHFSVSHFTYY